MAENEITFSIYFETTVAYTNRGEKCLVPLYYNECVNMIARDSRWPINVSFVSTNAAQGRLVSMDWSEVDFPNMIEILVANGYTVTITDANTYMITKTLGTGTTKKQSPARISDRKRGERHLSQYTKAH